MLRKWCYVVCVTSEAHSWNIISASSCSSSGWQPECCDIQRRLSVFIIEKEAKLLYKVVMKLLVLRINKCGLSFTKTR